MNEYERIIAAKEHFEAWMFIFWIVLSTVVIGIFIALVLFVVYGWSPILTRLTAVLMLLLVVAGMINRYLIFLCKETK